MSISIIVLVVVVLLVLWLVIAFNGLVRLTNQAKEALADIDVQLKRRYDLIPNLVNTVKGYATHESEAFEKVSAARSAAMQAPAIAGAGASASTGGLAQKAQAEEALSGTLKSLFAIAEAYPDLKANTNFLDLQRELSDTENKIQAARRFYNGTVRDLNISTESFPSNIVASSFHFSKMEMFGLTEEDAAAKNAVEVKF